MDLLQVYAGENFLEYRGGRLELLWVEDILGLEGREQSEEYIVVISRVGGHELGLVCLCYQL